MKGKKWILIEKNMERSQEGCGIWIGPRKIVGDLKSEKGRERILGWRDSMSRGRKLERTWHIQKWHVEELTEGVGNEVSNISGCFIRFILGFVKNGEPWFIFVNRAAWKDLCFKKVTLAVCQISNYSSSWPRKIKYINRASTRKVRCFTFRVPI